MSDTNGSGRFHVTIVDERKGEFPAPGQEERIKDSHVVIRIHSDGTAVGELGQIAINDGYSEVDQPDLAFFEALTEREVSLAKAEADKARRLGDEPSAEHDNEAAIHKAAAVWHTAPERLHIEWPDTEDVVGATQAAPGYQWVNGEQVMIEEESGEEA